MPPYENDSHESPLDVSPFKGLHMGKTLDGWAADLISIARFYTRLPLSEKHFGPHIMPDFSRAARVVPLIGALVGVLGFVSIYLLSGFGFHPVIVAVATVLILVLLTGAFHEDGLADSADGLGGGVSVDAKLEIMKDSRLGTYGALSLFLVMALKITALYVLIEDGSPVQAGLLLIGFEAMSRTSALLLGYLLPAAREDGAAFAAGKPSRDTMLTAFGIAGLIMVLCVWTAIGLMPMLITLIGGLLAGVAGVKLAKAQLGGHTGDLAGATQLGSCVIMLLLSSLYI